MFAPALPVPLTLALSPKGRGDRPVQCLAHFLKGNGGFPLAPLGRGLQFARNPSRQHLLHILPLNNSPFLAYIWLTFINVIDSSPAFMGMRSDLF